MGRIGQKAEGWGAIIRPHSVGNSRCGVSLQSLHTAQNRCITGWRISQRNEKRLVAEYVTASANM